MKVVLPRPGKSGKGQFVSRLQSELEGQGVRVLFTTNHPHDLYLSFSFFRMGSRKPRLLRMDGVYYNKHSRKDIDANARLKKGLRKAQGVIYQSEFSKLVCDSYLGRVSVPTAIIPNGANPLDFDVRAAESDYKYNFLAVARWRKFKRLREIIKAFQELDNPDSCLWIAGSDSIPKVDAENINYLGMLRPQKLARYYQLADATLHLSWADACPNTVVESISSGTPVICNNVGGTPELVKGSGIICEVDRPYDFDNFNPYSYPKINIDPIVQSMQSIIDGSASVDMERPDLHIKNVAKQYVEFFKRILKR